jgi:uncharacterized protein YoxC
MLLTISVTVIAAVLVIVLIAFIVMAWQICRTAREVQKLLDTVRSQITPLGHDLTVLLQEIRGIFQSIHHQVDKMEEGVNAVRDTAVRFREFEEGILSGIEAPLLRFGTLIRAVRTGIDTFFHSFRR